MIGPQNVLHMTGQQLGLIWRIRLIGRHTSSCQNLHSLATDSCDTDSSGLTIFLRSQKNPLLTCNYLVAYYPSCEDGPGFQSSRRFQPPQVARPLARGQRPGAWRSLQAPRHEPPGRHQALEIAGVRQPGGHRLARPRETPLPESRPDSRNLRTLDWKV